MTGKTQITVRSTEYYSGAHKTFYSSDG